MPSHEAPHTDKTPDAATLARWLDEEMARRNYPRGEPGERPGGSTRLSKETGIPLSTLSRILNGETKASDASLRKIGQALGFTFGEMLVHAGRAAPEEMVVRASPDAVEPDLTVYEALGLDRSSCDIVERQILEFTTALNPENRRALAEVAWRFWRGQKIEEKAAQRDASAGDPVSDMRRRRSM